MTDVERSEAANAHAFVEMHRSELIADLVEYANLETPSDDLTLLARGLRWLEAYLTSRLGAPTCRSLYSSDSYGDTVVLDYPYGRGTDPWVTVLCHYDTVWPAGTGESWPVAQNGDRITGPGVFDMKGGLVQFVWAMVAARELGLARPNVRLVLNGDEEIGSPASRRVIESECLRGEAVLVFESSAAGALKTARKGVGIFEVTITGVEVHAGLDPESGASAIDELWRVIRTLHSASDLDRGTTVNVGVVHGGTRGNVKAGFATATVDVRVSAATEATRIDAALASLTPHNKLAHIAVTGGWNRPVMERSTATGLLFAQAKAVAAALGVDLEDTSVGGASDGNFAAALGLPTLDGLGAVGAGAHARTEWISIDGMIERSAIVAGLLAALTT